jgi:hypothetical protein
MGFTRMQIGILAAIALVVVVVCFMGGLLALSALSVPLKPPEVRTVAPLPASGRVSFDGLVVETGSISILSLIKVRYGNDIYTVLSGARIGYYKVGQTYHFTGNRRSSDGVIEIRAGDIPPDAR